MHLTALSLSHFRNYLQLRLNDLPCGLVAFSGANGAGKTNILEAVSLLAPGRGLRGARDDDIQSRVDHHQHPQNPGPPWAVHAALDGRYGPQELGLGHDPVKNRRMVHLNSQPLKNAADRAELFRCAWLTPAQDRIFTDGAQARRKLLDRWVFTADPAHAGRLARLDRLLTERNRLLALPRVDALWLDAIETDLAATALAVLIARADYLDRLRAQVDQGTDALFPRPTLEMTGFLEDRIGSVPALTIEGEYKNRLRDNRAGDAQAGGTTLGPHRADLCVTYADKSMPADQCSTGEQKALLFALFMAHVRLVTRETGEAPVLLLDEITAHLDPARRVYLLGHLLDLGAQVLMTATTDDQFSGVRVAMAYAVQSGTVSGHSEIN